MSDFADTPQPPYYAVIFASTMTGNEALAYAEAADRMQALAQQQDGFLGVESAREDIGITVSYWRDEAAIKAWKQQIDHVQVREQGRAKWYGSYSLRIAKVV
jgi:heme-degrading monooxygenase HmoA